MRETVTAQHQVGMAQQFAGNLIRFGWYSSINWLAQLVAARAQGEQALVSRRHVHHEHAAPSREELLADLRNLFRADCVLVRDGLAVADAAQAAHGLLDHMARLRAMFADLGDAAHRRSEGDAATIKDLADVSGYPDYFVQDFHFQKGGYLAEGSARLYDVQVETLFYGAAAAMRRMAMRPIAKVVSGRDQRNVALLDVACGTGRLLREIRLQYPAMRLTGLDLSPAYLREAERHLSGLRRVELIAANAEEIPLRSGSQDIVTTVFLFHELPGEVRRRVAREMARVLKPGGWLVFIDSIQMGDRPGWDGLLEAFPQRYHEPYYRQYAIDDLDGIFTDAGLRAQATATAFLAKMMVRAKS